MPGTLILLVCLLVNALFLKASYLLKFEPMDYGGFIDLAWRFIQGQRPYVDFLYHAGPVFPLTHALFIKIFGLGSPAVLAHLLFTSSAYLLAVFWIARKYLPAGVTALVLALTTVTFQWYYPFPNFINDAYLWGLVAAAFVAVRLPFPTPAAAAHSFFFCGAFTAISCLTKHNIGVPYAAAYFGAAAVSDRRTSCLLGYLAGLGSAFAAMAFFFIPDLPAFYGNISWYLGEEQRRWANFLTPSALWVRQYWQIALVSALGIYPREKKYPELFALMCGAAFVSYFSYHTNTVKQITHVPLLMGFVLLYRAAADDPAFRKSLRFYVAAAGLVILGLAQTRPTVEEIFRQQKLSRQIYTHPIQAAPLTGWRSHPAWGGPMDHFLEKIRREVRAEDSLLLLDKMQILYPLAGRKSYPGVLFHFFLPGINRSPAQRQLMHRAITENPPDWILTGYGVGALAADPSDPRGFVPVMLPFDELVHVFDLEQFFQAHYEIRDVHGRYALLRKKGHVG
jgi:hypothetical protein